MRPSVLVVDDEQAICSLLSQRLKEVGYTSRTANGPRNAIEALQRDPAIGVVVVDIRMPDGDGLDFMAEAKRVQPDLQFIVVTGHGGLDEAVKALRLGATDFLRKPLRFKDVRDAVDKCARHFEDIEADRTLRSQLQAFVKEKDDAVLELRQTIDSINEETVATLAAATELRDEETGAHNRRIGAYVAVFAEALGWPPHQCRLIGAAAQLHDIGKIGVPDGILLKPGRLTDAEFAQIKMHTEIGHRILTQGSSALANLAASIALNHHERWDGSGYLRGLAGDAIPIEARMTAVADVYDALRSQRPYKEAFSHETAMRIILEGDARTNPQHFDPALLEAFGRRNVDFDRIWRTNVSDPKVG